MSELEALRDVLKAAWRYRAVTWKQGIPLSQADCKHIDGLGEKLDAAIDAHERLIATPEPKAPWHPGGRI